MLNLVNNVSKRKRALAVEPLTLVTSATTFPTYKALLTDFV